jgi:hypothetical protein
MWSRVPQLIISKKKICEVMEDCTDGMNITQIMQVLQNLERRVLHRVRLVERKLGFSDTLWNTAI